MTTQKRLKELFYYRAESGDFVRMVPRSQTKAGDVAGSCHKKGYLNIRIDGKLYLSHRLAWLYVTGHWPADQIDHINGVKDDNRFCNLREATNSENKRNTGLYRNNTSGYKGVYLDKRNKEWTAKIRLHGVYKYLGSFTDITDAAAAYAAASAKHHGVFANIGAINDK